jgi:hypothetical protein
VLAIRAWLYGLAQLAFTTLWMELFKWGVGIVCAYLVYGVFAHYLRDKFTHPSPITTTAADQRELKDGESANDTGVRADGTASAAAMGPLNTLWRYPWPLRFVAWLVGIMLLPWAAAALLASGLKKESNGINMAMLIGLTFVSVLIGCAFINFRESNFFSLVFAAGALAALGYNWVFLSGLEDQRVGVA